MTYSVWRRVIRPSIRLGSSIIFVLFVLHRGAGLAGNGPLNYHQFPPKWDFSENLGPSQIGRSSSSVREGDASRPAVRRLAESVGEDVTQNGEDSIRKLYSQESEFDGGEVLQPLDLSPESGSELKVAIPVQKTTQGSTCTDAWEHPGYSDSCSYVRATPECSSGTLIEYTEVFFCNFSGTSVFAYAALILYLAALFYTLGDTAHNFFCDSMHRLSQFLSMSSTLAGVTLLPFGNGAPDVFASIAAFASHSGQGQVGLNSVLGGAMFVSTVVAGSVGLAIKSSGSNVELDRGAFLRDVTFFLVSLAALTYILSDGEIRFLEAVAYLAIYVIYVGVVLAVEFITWRVNSSNDSLGTPLLTDVASVDETPLPPGRLAPNGDIEGQESPLIPNPQLSDEEEIEKLNWCSLRGVFSCLTCTLTVPRRLTIPLIQDGRLWSKGYAVCSVTFAPILLALVWDGEDGGPFGSARAEYIVAGSVGIVLGVLSLIFLRKDHPPVSCKALWAAGGFIMSMVWFYVIAVELVAVLVALGAVWQIDPAIFGLTVLAWGNSIGDMMSNLALASHGDRRVQTSFSGCYAGPMFNTLIGIGVSFLLESWKTYPSPFAIPEDSTIFITLAFLVIGLVWSLLMMSRDMQPTKRFGVGQWILYTLFLATRLACALDIKSLMTRGLR